MCNGFWLGLVLLTVHLVVCGGLWLLARARTLEVEGYFVPVMLLVPLWGPLCVLLLHTSNRLTGGCSREQMLEKLRINDEIYKNVLVADDEGKEAVVPLEEALLVNSPAQKRKLILSVLTDDPAGYYDLLQQAEITETGTAVCRCPGRCRRAGRILRLSGKLFGKRLCAGQSGGDPVSSAGAAAEKTNGKSRWTPQLYAGMQAGRGAAQSC